MSSMFQLCVRLKRLDLSNFNTIHVNNMKLMFSMCYFLEELDISSFVISDEANTTDMFSDCPRLKRIKAPTDGSSRTIILRQLVNDGVHCEIIE